MEPTLFARFFLVPFTETNMAWMPDRSLADAFTAKLLVMMVPFFGVRSVM